MATPFYSPKREASGASSTRSVHGKPTLVRPFFKQASGRGTTKQGPKTSSVPAAWGPRRRSAWRSKPARSPRSGTPAAGSRLRAVWTSAGAFKGTFDGCKNDDYHEQGTKPLRGESGVSSVRVHGSSGHWLNCW